MGAGPGGGPGAVPWDGGGGGGGDPAGLSLVSNALGSPLLPRASFGAVQDGCGALRLYTVQVPHKRERRPPPCYLTKWDGGTFLPLLTRPCGSEVISCLSVRYVGRAPRPPHPPPAPLTALLPAVIRAPSWGWAPSPAPSLCTSPSRCR